jgi:hypothetical protein
MAGRSHFIKEMTMYRRSRGCVFSILQTPSLRSGTALYPTLHQQNRPITFTAGTEKLLNSKDPQIKKNIEEIKAADKKAGKETVVLKAGVLSHYNIEQRAVYLPHGDEDPVASSHELQHARDYATHAADTASSEVLERRAYTAQKSTADFLNLDDQLGGKTPTQRAATHAQVVNKKIP